MPTALTIATSLAILSTPPPIIAVGPPTQSLSSYRAGDVRCGDAIVAPEHAEPVLSTVLRGKVALYPVTLRFRIDAGGRPLGVVTGEQSAAPYQRNDDLIPAFVAWAFPAGRPHDPCEVTFDPVVEPVGDASPEALQRYIALSTFRTGPSPEVYARAKTTDGGPCLDDRPQVLVQVFPEYKALPARPASIAQTTVGFDIDNRGATTAIRTISSDGNAALDRAALEAIAGWRHADGPRKGCLYPFHRNQTEPLAPPPAPEPASFAPVDARCEASPWESELRLNYPEAYRRRAIEGWAVIGFDVAPWGETGNLKVLASEPTFEFGEAAKRIVGEGRKSPSAQGATGCAERVVFKMSPTPARPPVVAAR